MSADAPRELMLLVERIVRPLPVSLRRKKRIRDEFLEHLSAVYAKELARDGDPAMASARTQARFGDPLTLHDEFPLSAHPIDDWRRLLEACVIQWREESIACYALRLVTIQLALSSVIFLIAPIRVALAVLLFMAVGFGGVCLFGLSWGQEWEHQRRRSRLALLTLGLFASFPAALSLMFLVAGSSPQEFVQHWPLAIGFCLFALTGGPLFGVLHTRDMAYLREWAELELAPE